VTMTASSPKSAPAVAEAPKDPRLVGVLERLMAVRGSKVQKPVMIKEDEVTLILSLVREILMAEPGFLRVDPPVKIVGDTHGQYYDLLQIFEKCGFIPATRYLFLGDYVDRGKFSIETIVLLFLYKIMYPTSIYLLRGNHECAAINKMYGFFDDAKRRYNVKIWKQFTDVFNTMPFAAMVSDKILCMHGGISPELTSLRALEQLQRPCDVPETGLLCDLLWADPDEEVKGFVQSDRGVSYLFGADAVAKLLNAFDMDIVVRAHQVMERGYSFFTPERQLVTIFSAPNYCGEFDNDGAVMQVDAALQCSFQIIKGS